MYLIRVIKECTHCHLNVVVLSKRGNVLGRTMIVMFATDWGRICTYVSVRLKFLIRLIETFDSTEIKTIYHWTIHNEKMMPNIKKGSYYGGTGRFHHCQAKSGNFIQNKKKSVRRCENIKNDVFDLVTQGHTKLCTIFMKACYYICEIIFQRSSSDVQYTVKNMSRTTLSVLIQLEL